MKALRALVCAVSVLAVASCGGGGGGKGKGSKAAPAATVSVAITTQAISSEVILGDSFTAAVGGTWTGANLGSNPVYLQISDSAGTFAMPGTQIAGGSGFNYTLPLVTSIAAGTRNGTFTVRACKDAQCTQPYTNASAAVSYQLQVFEPTVTVAIGTPAIVESVDLGDNYSTTVAGTWGVTRQGTNKIYLQISDNAGTFATPAPQLAAAAGPFNYVLPLAAGLPTTPRSGLLTVRACRDAMCTQPYKDAIASVGYTMQFMRIAEWETHQRNAAHDGYVPITLDPARFAKAWEWELPGMAYAMPINPVATGDGMVYISNDGDNKLYAIDEVTGQARWNVTLGNVFGVNPPAFNSGRIYVATTGHQDTFLWSFDAADGTFKFKSLFDAQWPHVLAPTVYGGQVYTNGGYYGGGVYAYDRMVGTRLWYGNNGGDDDMSTPAIDENNAYYHNGAALVIWNRMTGELVAKITDPFATPMGYSYHGSPVLGGRNNVVAFAGSAFSGRASSAAEQYEQRVLSSFNITTKAWEWASRDAYLTHPAIAKGVIYAARNSPMSLDAIDEATGRVLWNWVPTAGQGDTDFHRNIVVTRNLLFVSTNASVYAIDLATRKPVWHYPAPGMLAISSNRTLYIATGATDSNGKLVAIKLK